MEIGRKIFYDKVTGVQIVDTGQYDNAIRAKTIDEEILSYPELSERNRETFDVLELAYGAYANDFREGTLVGVDLVARIPIFSYPDPNAPSETITPIVPMSTQIEKLQVQDEELNLAVIDIYEIVLGGI